MPLCAYTPSCSRPSASSPNHASAPPGIGEPHGALHKSRAGVELMTQVHTGERRAFANLAGAALTG
jgi:hypothetical protein